MVAPMRAAYEWIRQGLPVYDAHHGFYLLPLVGIALVAARHLVVRAGRGARTGRVPAVARGVLFTILVAAALLSVVVYNNFFNYHYTGYLNAYEFFHYYLGSKYAPEVGYFDLYGAALAADGETGRVFWPADGRMTDLRTHRLVPVADVLAEEGRRRARFSPDRWREWVQDVSFFKQRMGAAAWNRVLRDKGYNATPAWTWVGGSLSSRVPTSSAGGMLALALLDACLLAGAACCVGWAFGAWPALLSLVFLASSYLMAHVHMKGAFLRTDFVVCLVVAICMMRKGLPAVAGALVGYSAMTRLFPALFLFGPAVRALVEFSAAVRRPAAGTTTAGERIRGALSRLDVRHARFFGGFAVSIALLSIGSAHHAGGIEAWSRFARKISVHRADYHPWNVGLPSVVAAEFEAGRPVLPAGAVERRGWTLGLIQLAAVAACAYAARGLAGHRALAFGFVPTFFLVAPTYYYYIVLLVPFVFLAERLDRVTGALGLAYLFFFGLAGHVLYQRWEQQFPTYYGNSLLALGLALYVLAVGLRESARADSGVFPRRDAGGTAEARS